MKYRKKPVEIEAEQVSMILKDSKEDWKSLPAWVSEAYEKGTLLFLPDSIEVKTLEGTMTAKNYDMLIRGVEGEIYPCKPGIFLSTYEPVE